MKIIKTDMENLGEPTKEQGAQIQNKYGLKIKNAMTSITQSMRSLKKSSPEASDLVAKVMQPIMQK